MLVMKCDEENQKSIVAEQRFVLLNKKKRSGGVSNQSVGKQPNPNL